MGAIWWAGGASHKGPHALNVAFACVALHAACADGGVHVVCTPLRVAPDDGNAVHTHVKMTITWLMLGPGSCRVTPNPWPQISWSLYCSGVRVSC